ncbi:cell wall-binding repeat-containing protein [Clostridium botulinum]|nr:cell wall-binding repeat-containing protein [Clostridium botulinum]
MNKKSTRALASATVVGLVLATVATGNVQAAPGKVDRLGGSNRYQTAANVATKNWEKSDNVILVSGEGYADALSASLLAQKLDAPVLLTGKDGLDGDTNKAIEKLGAKNVYILGSEGVVSKNVQTSLEKSGKTVKRLAGNNRFQTNVAIANELVKNHGVKADDVLVVNGNKYLADALTAAPVAAKEGKILLLVGEDLSTAKEAKEFIKNNGVKNVTVIGRDVTVSDEMYKDLGATKRVSGGKDRFETNRLVLQAFGLKGSHLYVANGQDDHLVDSLVASAIAGKFNSPVVLVSNNKDIDDKAVEYIKENANEKTDLNVVGSEAILSNDLVEEINNSVNPQLVAAEKAVKAYEDAKITNLEEITAAKTLGADAVKAVEDVKDAAKKEAFQARIAAKDKLVKEAEAKLGVKAESVTAINSRTVKVIFPEGSKIEAKDLKDKKITLKAGEVVLTATYAEGSLDKSTAVFAIDDKKELVDATTYTVSADWANFAKTDMLAKITRPYAKTFESVTTKVASNLDEKGDKKDNAKISLTAKDQYGEDIKLDTTTGSTLDVKGTLNGMPLSKDEIVIGDNKDTVEIKRGLKEGDKLSITVQNKSGEKVIGESTFEYTVGKVEVAVPTSIVGIKAAKEGKEVTEVAALDTLTLTADVRDQFNNPMAGKDVRWVVAEGKELLDGATKEGSNFTSLGNDNAILDAKQTTTLKVVKPGKVVIEAYNKANGAKAVYTFEVGAKKLTNITAPTDFNGTFNNEELKTTSKFSVNEGAGLTADAIKFNVVSKTTGVEASDIQVSAQLRGGDKDNKNDIILVAKTSKPGKFEITPYIGTSFNDEKAVKANTVTLETKLNDIATSVATIGDISAKVGTPVEKEIVIKNKHNEVITAESTGKLDGNYKVFKDGQQVLAQDSVTVEEVRNSKTGKLEKVRFTAKAAGNFVVRISVGDSAAFTEVKVSAEVTKLASINLGTDIYDGVIAGDTENVYRVIDTRDNKGDSILVDKDKLEVTGKGTTLEYVAKDKDGKLGVVDQAKAEAVALVINPKDLTETKDQPNVIKVTSGSTDTKDLVEASINVTVKAARVAKTVEIKAPTTNVALNGNVTITVIPKDQYGKFIAVGADKITVDAGANFNSVESKDITEVKDEKDDSKVVAYQVKLTGKTKGTNNVVVNVKEDEKVLATNKVSMTVDAVGNLVNSVSIDTKDAKGNPIKSLYSTEKLEGTVNLNPIAKDVNGSVVPVASEDLNWTVVSVEGQMTTKDGDKDVVKPATKDDVKVENGTVTAKVGFKGKAVIKVVTANMKEATITLNFDNAAPVAQKGTVKVVGTEKDQVIDANKDREGIQIALDDDKEAKDGEKDGSITVKVTAKDQYDEEFEIKDGIVVLVDDSSVVTKDVKANAITLTAKGVGDAGVNVNYAGDTVKLEVAVNDKAVKAANDATAAVDQATVNAKIASVQASYELAQDTENTDEAKMAGVKSKVQTAIKDNTIVVGVEKDTENAGKFKVTLTKNGKIAVKDNIIVTIAVDTDQAAVDTKLTSVQASYELDAGTQDTPEAKIAGVKSKVQTAIDDATITVDVKEDSNNAGKFKVTLTKNGKTAMKDNIEVTIAS